jgi:hypothetical protein
MSLQPNTLYSHFPDFPEPQVTEKLVRLVADLPVEILGEIFIHCLPCLKNDELERFPESSEAPMLLCQVCPCWTEIMLNMPTLWTSFSAMSSLMHGNYAYLSLMKLWLKCSEPCSLLLELDEYESDSRHLKTSFPIFLAEVNHWRKISLSLNKTLCNQFLAALPGHESCLESLSFCTLNCMDEQAIQLPSVLNKFT